MTTNMRRLLLVAVLAVAVTSSCITQEHINEYGYPVFGVLLIAWLIYAGIYIA